MTDQQMEQTEEAPLGPVDYVVMEFAEAKFTGEGLPLLLDLVDRGIVRILDASFVKANEDGTFLGISVEDLDQTGGVWEVLAGSTSGLLSQEDFDAVGALLAPGAAAGIIVYENTWAGPFAAAMLKAGAEVISFGRIGVEDLLAALEPAPEPTPSD